MAQLARCPECKSDVVLPDVQAPGSWGQCPECNEVFALAQAIARPLPEVQVVQAPDVESSSPLTASLATEAEAKEGLGESSVSFGGTTLSSFLKDQEQEPEPQTKDRVDGSEQQPAATAAPTLAELLSQPSEDIPESVEPTDVESTALDEPNPEADRQKPTLSELFKFDAATVNENEPPTDDVERYDSVDEQPQVAAAEQSEESTTELPESLSDFAAKLDALSDKISDESSLSTPTFDFEVGEADATPHDANPASPDDTNLGADQPLVETPSSQPQDVPQTTARSMRDTLDFDSPLEFESKRDHSAVSELDFPEPAEDEMPVMETPPGVVVSRRSSGPSMLRTLTGVAGGGVVGLGAGYLLLLWILHFLGRADDPLNVAMYYPNAVKPATFQQNAEPAESSVPPTSDRPITDQLAAADNVEQPAADAVAPVTDEAVEPAAFNEDLDELPSADSNLDAPFPWEVEDEPEAVAAIAISNAPIYSALEVDDLVRVGAMASQGLLDGNFAEPEHKKVVPTKGASYAKLAKLADAITFAELAGEIADENQAASVFPPLFATERHRSEIAQIAGFWLGSSKRGHGGIFFCGRPDSGTQQGSVAEYRFLLPSGQTMTVITDQPLGEGLASSHSVGVVGSVIDSLAERIEGYTGNAETAIWSTELFPLNTPKLDAR